jgi:hypothetical protein
VCQVKGNYQDFAGLGGLETAQPGSIDRDASVPWRQLPTSGSLRSLPCVQEAVHLRLCLHLFDYAQFNVDARH